MSIKKISVFTVREEEINVDPIDAEPARRSSPQKKKKEEVRQSGESRYVNPPDIKQALNKLRDMEKNGKLSFDLRDELKGMAGYLTKEKKIRVIEMAKEAKDVS